MGHTPGPWYARRTHSDGYVTHLVSLDADPIEDEFYYGRNIAVGLSGNDARLIAAAPDLLAACEMAELEETNPHILAVLQSAIAKARAEEER